MNSARSINSYYVASFVLGALIALVMAAPARSAEAANPNVAGGDVLVEIHRVTDTAMDLSAS
jgi:hypothetical protein